LCAGEPDSPSSALCIHARFKVLTPVLMKVHVLRDVMPCGLAVRSPCFEGSQCLHLQAEAVQEE